MVVLFSVCIVHASGLPQLLYVWLLQQDQQIQISPVRLEAF